MNKMEKMIYEDRLNLDEIKNAVELEKVKAQGFEVYEPSSNELILDIDKNCYNKYLDREASIRLILEEYLNIHIKELKDQQWASKSNESGEMDLNSPRHIVRNMDQGLDIMERLLIELIFGSDYNKILFDYIRIKKGINKPHVLFKPTESYWENKKKYCSTSFI